VAGLALLATLSASLSGALSAVDGREAAAITFVVAASGLTFLGIGAAFWALVAGLLVRAVLPRAGQTVRPATASPAASPPPGQPASPAGSAAE
jgi:benzoate membrane transport protein